MSDDIVLHEEGGVAILTLNRPEAMNALSAAMFTQLGELYRYCDAEDRIRAVVVTGVGDAFCSGADMGGGGDTFSSESKNMDFSSCPLSFQAYEVRKPVIAACNGHAVGAGLSIALQADLRIFAEQGKYGLLQNRRGVLADFAVEHVLTRLVGFERAFEILVRAVKLSGSEAAAWGLASRVLPADQVLSTALEVAHDMAENCAPLVMGMHKRLLWRALDQSMDELIADETRALHHTMSQSDAVEGGVAYMERRAPEWSGSISKDWPEWLR